MVSSVWVLALLSDLSSLCLTFPLYKIARPDMQVSRVTVDNGVAKHCWTSATDQTLFPGAYIWATSDNKMRMYHPN